MFATPSTYPSPDFVAKRAALGQSVSVNSVQGLANANAPVVHSEVDREFINMNDKINDTEYLLNTLYDKLEALIMPLPQCDEKDAERQEPLSRVARTIQNSANRIDVINSRMHQLINVLAI